MSAEGVVGKGPHSGAMPDAQDAAQGPWPLPLLFLMGLDGHDAIGGALGHLVCFSHMPSRASWAREEGIRSHFPAWGSLREV